MIMIYFLLPIFVLTLIFWVLYRAKLSIICPICAGTLLTWAGGLVALYSGAAWADPLIIGILMGASLGALADKYGSRFGLFWKSAVVLLGLPATYFLVQKFLWPGVGLVLLIVLLTWFFGRGTKPEPEPKKDLFKDCC